jgi:hypothetical protein
VGDWGHMESDIKTHRSEIACVNSIGRGQEPAEVFCKYNNEVSGSVKSVKFHAQIFATYDTLHSSVLGLIIIVGNASNCLLCI